MTESRPIIRLLPKVNPGHLRAGAPWAYSDQIVLDRRSRAVPAGSIVQVHDTNRQPLGVAGFNPASKIALRMLDSNPEAQIGPDWLRARLSQAQALRDDLFDAPYYRLVHAEADGLPGVIIDRFGDAAVIQPNAAWADALIEQIADALADVVGVRNIYLSATGRTRTLEGLDNQSRILRGAIDAPVPVPMNGATYLADLTGGQKTGLFYDQRDNHAFAARLARGRDVLDVFAHVGGFALAALAGGATRALAVDSSAPALALALGGARASGLEARFETRQGDAFDTMAALAADGARHGMVVCDPPAFAPNKQALGNGLRAYGRVARLGAALVAPGGYLVLCSCSHAADLAQFREASLGGLARSGRRVQIVHQGAAAPDHPTHPYLAESAYLKSLFLRLE